MRPPEFTTEAIIQAGQELQAAGRVVTGFALRQKTGGGNPNRLKQTWEEHINSQNTTKTEPVAELPVEVAEEVANVTRTLTERLAAMAVELNDKAVKAAERRVSEVIRTAGEQREQTERELADAAQTLDDLEAKLDEVKTGSEGLETRLTEMLAASQAQAVELAQVRERLALTEQSAVKAAEEHTAELDRLNSAIESERARHRADLDEAKKAIQVATSERDEARNGLATAKAKSEAASDALQEHRKQAAAEAHRTAERLTKAQSERDEARKDASVAREETAQLRGRGEALQAQVGDLTNALARRAV